MGRALSRDSRLGAECVVFSGDIWGGGGDEQTAGRQLPAETQRGRHCVHTSTDSSLAALALPGRPASGTAPRGMCRSRLREPEAGRGGWRSAGSCCRRRESPPLVREGPPAGHHAQGTVAVFASTSLTPAGSRTQPRNAFLLPSLLDARAALESDSGDGTCPWRLQGRATTAPAASAKGHPKEPPD